MALKSVEEKYVKTVDIMAAKSHEVESQTIIPFPAMDDQTRADLSDLKGKVEELELKELVRDCKKTVKKAVKEQRPLVQSEKNKLIGLYVARVALIALAVLGLLTVAVLLPVVTILAGLGGIALLPVGIAMAIGGALGTEAISGKIDSVNRGYQDASKDLSEKEIRLSNLKDVNFVKFAQALEGISLNEETLTSKELHDLYSKERKVVDLQKQIGVVKKHIDAETGSIGLANSVKERVNHEKILADHQNRLRNLDAEKGKLEAEVKKDKTALKATS